MVFNKLGKKLKQLGGLVMFSHTVFSLPFGIIAMLWAAKGFPDIWDIIWILAALVSARNGANAFNRIADREIDKKNERTKMRHIPSGQVHVSEAVLLCIFCFTVMAISALMLNLTCLILLPFAVILFVFYSYAKRFTWLCHYILGLCCGGAPVGAWIAVTGGIDLPAVFLGGAVCMWVAGFDIIYATQDIKFDKTEGLFSIPARFGFKGALWFARLSHITAVFMLCCLYFIMGLGGFYLAGIAVISVLLIVEHYNIMPENREKMIFASYSVNQMVSIAFFVFAGIDFLVRQIF